MVSHRSTTSGARRRASNAASFRVRERSELTALDAAEAYIDVVRFLRLVALADQNVRITKELFSQVKSRYSGGLAGEGDIQQALERSKQRKQPAPIFSARLDDARSKYRKMIGVEAYQRRIPWAAARPSTVRRMIALAVALRRNPTLLATGSPTRRPQLVQGGWDRCLRSGISATQSKIRAEPK